MLDLMSSGTGDCLHAQPEGCLLICTEVVIMHRQKAVCCPTAVLSAGTATKVGGCSSTSSLLSAQPQDYCCRAATFNGRPVDELLILVSIPGHQSVWACHVKAASIAHPFMLSRSDTLLSEFVLAGSCKVIKASRLARCTTQICEP